MITVLTPTLSDRYLMLEECKQSVQNQTLKPFEHLIKMDTLRNGEAAMRNNLLQAAKTEWVAFLDDDDLFLPYHLEMLWNARHEGDVIYSDCRVEGMEKHWQVKDFNLENIKEKNYISITVLARREALLITGGFRPVSYPDWDMWIRLGEKGIRFKFVPMVTWVYRIGKNNLIFQGGQ
jgi:glycosyltransferase involved in cell wall biosynthesis